MSAMAFDGERRCDAGEMVSEKYTHGHPASVLRSHGWRTAENSAAYLLPQLRPGLDVLDVGCGPGTITIDLARIVGAGHAVGLDGAASAIEVAKKSAATADVDVSFDVGDAYGLSFEDDRFDVVHAHQLLQHLADPVAALQEMRRVCRPGGTVAVRDADYAAMSWWPLDPRLDRWLELYSAAARANGGEPDAGRRLIGWARTAGFADLRPSASVWCFAEPESRAWWAETWAERSTDSPLSEQLVREALATQAELQEIGNAWHEWSQHLDGWFAVVHGELLATVPNERYSEVAPAESSS